MLSHYRLIYAVIIFILILATAACDISSEAPTEEPRYFEITHQNGENDYSFVVQTSVPEVIEKVEEELSRPFEERNLHIHGEIARGSEDYNSNWRWHFVADEWDLVEVSTEVCDGTPGMVENDLDYWVDQVGNFCPWSARVSGEVDS